MKVILVIIALFTLVIGASINDMAVNILEQIYAGMFYIIGILAFIIFALFFNVSGINPTWKSGVGRYCGREHENGRILEQKNNGTTPDVIIVDLSEDNNAR